MLSPAIAGDAAKTMPIRRSTALWTMLNDLAVMFVVRPPFSRLATLIRPCEIYGYPIDRVVLDAKKSVGIGVFKARNIEVGFKKFLIAGPDLPVGEE